MTVSLSIKNVPDELLARLRSRASAHHRSLQGELLAILEDTLRGQPLAIEEADRRLRALGLKTGDDATAIIRAERDAR